MICHLTSVSGYGLTTYHILHGNGNLMACTVPLLVMEAEIPNILGILRNLPGRRFRHMNSGHFREKS